MSKVNELKEQMTSSELVLTSFMSFAVIWSTVVSLYLGPDTDGPFSNAAYLITVMNFIITSTPLEKNEGH